MVKKTILSKTCFSNTSIIIIILLIIIIFFITNIKKYQYLGMEV